MNTTSNIKLTRFCFPSSLFLVFSIIYILVFLSTFLLVFCFSRRLKKTRFYQERKKESVYCFLFLYVFFRRLSFFFVLTGTCFCYIMMMCVRTCLIIFNTTFFFFGFKSIKQKYHFSLFWFFYNLIKQEINKDE